MEKTFHQHDMSKSFQAKQHEMLHTGEKPYACTVYEKKIRQEKTLKDMKRTFFL